MVKTPTICFISDCLKTSGYDYQYHSTRIKDLYFDDAKPNPTFAPNWLRIEKYPLKITRLVRGETINRRYELKDMSLCSEKYPATIPYENEDDSEDNERDEAVLQILYEYKADKKEDYFEEVIPDISVVLELSEWMEPEPFSFDAIRRYNYSTAIYQVTNKDVERQLLDKIVYPELCLHQRPCSFTSQQVYDITRQYIIDHIDNRYAKITSNYDFCFTVKKVVPKIAPQTITYQNLFAKSKKERSKIHTSIVKYDEYEIFEMTHEQEPYKGYTPIPRMIANTEGELSAKMSEWLESVMSIINKPLEQCPHCNGTGFSGEIESAKLNSKFQKFNWNSTN